MSRAARYTGMFGDGRHDFVLNIAELEELQEKCDAGPEEIMDRVLKGTWRLADLREPLRLGLKGGGMDAMSALVLVERYAGPGNLSPHKPLVVCILSAALVGAEDEPLPPPGEPKARGKGRSRAAKSGSDDSTRSGA